MHPALAMSPACPLCCSPCHHLHPHPLQRLFAPGSSGAGASMGARRHIGTAASVGVSSSGDDGKPKGSGGDPDDPNVLEALEAPKR